jgi:hypothetical protein
MDNILVELERIDHLAENEAATQPQLDNPIELPAKSELDDKMTIEIPAKPELDDTMKIELPATDPAVATAIIPEHLANEASDVAEKSVEMLPESPNSLAQIYQNNRGAFITVGLFFGTLVTLKLILAIVAAVDTIPLFAPFFQTIGLGYTGWFVYRYLLHASTRAELGAEINMLKSKVTGKSAT